MPVIIRERGYRFLFYSNEGFEPCHIHVRGQKGEAKFWVPSCELAWSTKFDARELNEMLRIIRHNTKLIEEKWHEHLNR